MKTRILHVVHSLNVGGLERVVIDLAGAFRSGGHDVAVCCLAGRGTLAEQAEHSGISIHALHRRPGFDLLVPWRVSRLIRKSRFEVIHTHNEAGLVYGLTGACLAGSAKIVHTEHGKEPGDEKKRALRMAERVLMKKVDHLVAVSNQLREEIVSRGVGNKPVMTIFNGIDPDAYRDASHRNETRASLGIDREDFVIGHIARLVRLKNHAFFLRVFRELIRSGFPVKLVAVGSGPLREELERTCMELGVAAHVSWLGERQDIPRLLAAFDLFVLPSVTEGISITLLEAMAAGIASLASEVGGNPEIIRDHETGRLLPLDDVGQWKQAIEHLITHQETRKRIAQSGREFVRKQFSLDAMVREYGRLYGVRS